MWSYFNQIRRALTSLMSPPCLLCGALQANFDNYCELCYKDLPHRHPKTEPQCQICAVQLGDNSSEEIICAACLQDPPAYDQVNAATHYLPPVTALMHAFKDEGQQGCGRLLSACLLRYLQRHELLTNPPTALIPVPLHNQRQRQRGFNQAEVIADYLGAATSIPVWTRHCVKIKPTASQQGQNKQQRSSNLHRSFKINQSFQDCEHIAIIDDVVTTGSTVNALAQAIRTSAGVDIRISVWCLARTLPPQSQLHLTHYD